MVHEEIGRLDDVVVNTDQNEIVNLGLGSLLRTILSAEYNDPTMLTPARSEATTTPDRPEPLLAAAFDGDTVPGP